MLAPFENTSKLPDMFLTVCIWACSAHNSTNILYHISPINSTIIYSGFQETDTILLNWCKYKLLNQAIAVGIDRHCAILSRLTGDFQRFTF